MEVEVGVLWSGGAGVLSGIPRWRGKLVIASFFALVASALVGVGLWQGHYYAVALFATWVAVELALFASNTRRFPRPMLGGPLTAIPYVLSLYRRADAASETALADKILALNLGGSLTEAESRCLDRLKEVSRLRGLCFGEALAGRNGLRQAFAYAAEPVADGVAGRTFGNANDISVDQITEAATYVADLYWRLFDACSGHYPQLTKLARRLYREIFASAFDADSARRFISTLTDSMQRDGGVPYLVLNLIQRNRLQEARAVGQALLTRDVEMDDELRATLYWVAEVTVFAREKTQVGDFDTTIRHLYHLCFTNPDRAGFLEIDSRFFAQFETVSELAREGFLFKETLVDKVLALWSEHEGVFDRPLAGVLESMAQSRSKIYEDRAAWVSFWRREREAYSRDYLYVIEGNLCYAAGHFEDARDFYRRALECNPGLRAARLNLVFALARTGERAAHARAVDEITADRQLMPAALYVAGDSYLLLGDRRQSDAYYDELRRQPGFERKVEYYRSTFCFENGLYREALEAAKRAHQIAPEDSAVSYHLSLCHNAVGEKMAALDVVKGIPTATSHPEWLDFYRFTLERDAGRVADASETLLRIPVDYYDDPEELQAALEFARGRKDLTLLRHLRQKRD